VICFSLPLLRLRAESQFEVAGLLKSKGADSAGFRCLSIRSDSSEATDSTLAERSGTSLDVGRGALTAIAGVVAS